MKSLKKTAKPVMDGHNILHPNDIRKSKEAYSPKNKSVKITPPVSRLNPLINSLSPSAKSTGARLVSASIHQTKRMVKIHPPECLAPSTKVPPNIRSLI